jgi:hypothetical protein
MARNGWVSLLCWGAVASWGGTSVTGCEAPPGPPTGSGVTPQYDQATGRLERIVYDRNGDGQPDAWMFMDGTRPVRAELDESHDGVVDRWEYFAAGGSAGAGLSGALLERVEVATAGSGAVTRREFYEGGRLARAEEDTTRDGRVDRWETWTDGALSTVALDTTGRGTPDRRFLYPPDGSAPVFELDEDGTGEFRSAPTAP